MDRYNLERKSTHVLNLLLGVCNLAIYLPEVKSKPQLMYRVFAPLISFIIIIFPITIVSIFFLDPGIYHGENFQES